MRLTIRTLGLTIFLTLLLACNNEDKKSNKDRDIVSGKPNMEKFDFPFYDTSLSIDERVKDLISRLTLEEKADQMMHNTSAIERLGIPPYSWWNEALHGVARSGTATVFPQAIGMAATFDENLIHKVSSAISDEARAMHNAAKNKGYHKQYGGLTFWTPNINIFRDPRWGRGQETYGEDPYLTSRLGIAFVKGLQGDNPNYLKTAACAKHYAVHSGPEELRHEFDAIANPKDLWETYLPAFEALVKEANVEAVMCAYNSTNGEPCCANKYLIQDVLLDKWDFKGHVLSDCWAIVDFFTPKEEGGHGFTNTPAEASALAVRHHVSLNCGSTYLEGIPEAVKEGLLTEKEVDVALARLLKTRFELGLFDPIGSNPYDAISVDVINNKEHRDLAREVAQKSIVLLKNNGVLPLRNDLSKYFITGPTAADSEVLLGNYFGVNPNMVTILEGLSNAIDPASQLQYRMGTMLLHPKANPLDYATGNASNSEVTFVALGISGIIEGEEGAAIASTTKGDRMDYNLPKSQIDYLRSLRESADRDPNDKKPIVTIITGGSPINLAEIEELSDAVLFVWYPGEEGGNAIADVVFGKVSPSGRLPITFPKSYGQLPNYEDYSMKGRTYKYMMEEPLYPFGFGLSYTTFKYENLKASTTSISKEEDVKLSIDVTNSGNVASDEVVQLYIKDVEASFEVPNCQLIGVKRIHLKAGETKNVSFDIDHEMFGMVNNQGNKVIEPGEFRFFVGGSSPLQRNVALGAPTITEVSVNVR